jgi:SRSO17 transposase
LVENFKVKNMQNVSENITQKEVKLKTKTRKLIKTSISVLLWNSKFLDDYSIHLSFVKNGSIKTQFYTFVTMVSKNWTEYSHSWKLYR